MEEEGTPRDQLIGQIRFGLSALPARNAHHEFEEACRHLAHARIAPNLLPATGPVSAGGDQGRDFESFYSYLAEALGAHGWFAGLVSSGPIAALCTLQGGSVAGKVLNDVEKICGAEPRPERIYAFLGNDMPVAQRHTLIQKARDKHHVELEVLDANAIAEQLADFDTYWIAVRYLSLPAQLAPKRPTSDNATEPQWYVDLRTRWRDSEHGPSSLAELIAVRDGLRHATFTPKARPDLAFWLDLMRPLATGSGADDELLQRARYEIVVASIRGLGDLRAVDAITDAFLADAAGTSDPARLEDASVVLSYAATAASIGHSDLDLTVLSERRRALRQRAAELLAENPPPVRRARLLQASGHLALSPDGARLTRHTGPPAASQVAALDQPREPPPPSTADGLREIADLDEALRYWTELSTLIPDTPLFPVDDFAEIVQYFTPALIDADGWEQLVSALDSAVSRVAGGARTGELCRDRAVALRKAGRPLDALHEIHRAKLEWWTGDTLRGALLAMSFIAQLYRDLQLPMAAKQYALAVAGAAQSSGEDELADLVPTGMLLASEISYQCGDWLAALEELEIGMIAMHALGQDETTTVSELAVRATFTAVMCLRAARELAPDLIGQVEEVLSRLGLLDVVTATLDGIEPMTETEWRSSCDEQLLGRPFSDAGDHYTLRFAALGTSWTLSCPNGYPHVRATQRLAAALQVTLVELASIDLCLMPTTIDLSIIAAQERAEDFSARIVSLPSNDGRAWELELTEYPAMRSEAVVSATQRELLAVITTVLLDVSLLPREDYLAAIERAFERGLSHKLVAGRPYDELAEIVPADWFDATGRSRFQPPLEQQQSEVHQHPDLGWQDAPGPTFLHASAEEMAHNRYDKITSLLPQTLARLVSAPAFQEVTATLRGEGWLDWHILVGVYNIAANYRLDEAGLNRAEVIGTAQGRRAAQQLTQTSAVDAGQEIPLSAFSEDAMRSARRMGIAPLLIHWGLEVRQRTPDYPAIEQVLTARYGYWSIDADHPDPFAISDDSS